MQINGMKEFFSRMMSLNRAAGTQTNTFLSVLPTQVQQKQPSYDLLSLSDVGQRLSLDTKKSPSLIEKQKADSTSLLSPDAQRIDKVMQETIDILEKMHKLAVAAQDKKLSNLERIEMQIEIEDLKTNLMAKPMSLRVGSPVSRLPRVPYPVELGHNGYGDYSSIFGRIRERIINGQEWDVREAWSPDGFKRVTYDENGDEVWEIGEPNAWYVVDDRNVLTRREGKIVDSGRKVPTAREILELAPVAVMDANSAVKGTHYLEQQIDSIKKWREQFSVNFDKISIDSASLFLESIVLPGGIISSPLTDPTVAPHFLFTDGIYDYRRTAQIVEKNDDDDILDPDWIKNKQNNDDAKKYEHIGSTLHADEIASFPLNDVKFIYVKGLRSFKQ